MKKITIILIVISFVFTGCEEVLTPVDENDRSFEAIYDDALFAQGILLNAYQRVPMNEYSFSEVATDDAVTNNKTSDLLQMATGQWSAINNPLSQWDNAYTAIMYLNRFLEEVEKVEWSYRNESADYLFSQRQKGEAYGLRALFMLTLLKTHGGYDASGQLLGVPIITEVLEEGSDFSKSRNTFEECMQQIYSDLNEAAKLLPTFYGRDGGEGNVPARYRDFRIQDYNRVFGDDSRLLLSGQAVKAIRAKAALLAASPAYTDGTTTTWEDAANYAADVLDEIDGVSGLDPSGALFFRAANVSAINLANSRDQAEMIWRTSREINGSSFLEEENFPPSLFGNGRVNPTQNLVDAFPMANGYPIDDPNSGFKADSPYVNRDPRLDAYIVVNGSGMGNDTLILTEENAGDNAVDELPTSTRTGYYLRKLLREDVNLDPAAAQPRQHYNPLIRYTEIFLAYAEAANEAWGPDGTGPNSYSARDVIAAIRERAGIAQPDDYLASVTSTEAMRELIRNERRLELCFEGFRFWDLRRWEADISEPARGIRISDGTYTTTVVERRLYEDHMNYPPLPHLEVLKNNLTQNNGW